jgi:hypothetical protein
MIKEASKVTIALLTSSANSQLKQMAGGFWWFYAFLSSDDLHYPNRSL